KEFEVGAGPLSEVRLRVLYYPYWQATSEGKQLTTRPASDGALLVSIPETAARIEIDFVEPASTYFAGVLSILGLVVIGFLSLTGFLKAKEGNSR
ncbi:MAG TPA: hypothetical protein VK475_06030, partial [Pyrinomonadaceae bacterium]|nr:hypothetical protein [Pyrinomonadaceae bacterium]